MESVVVKLKIGDRVYFSYNDGDPEHQGFGKIVDIQYDWTSFPDYFVHKDGDPDPEQNPNHWNTTWLIESCNNEIIVLEEVANTKLWKVLA